MSTAQLAVELDVWRLRLTLLGLDPESLTREALAAAVASSLPLQSHLQRILDRETKRMVTG